jgi:carbon monoxide dehydrogenase subunit G
MVRLHETLQTTLPTDQAFAFLADFSNSERWDPGTAWSEPVDDPTPRVGAEYRLGVRMGRRIAPMSYRIVAIEPGKRVVFSGRGPNVSAVDDIKFSPSNDGTLIDYTAYIELTGLLRLVSPFAGRAFGAIGRDARDGMARALEALASGAQSTADTAA